MPNNIHIINPTQEKNIHIVCELMRAAHGDKPGYLHSYEPYTLTTPEGEEKHYVLTLNLLQFVAAPSSTSSHIPHLRIDVVELTCEAEGACGCIFPVIKSIIFDNGHPVFDTTGNYIIKKILLNLPDDRPSKLNKPPYYIRAAHREQYFASQMPKLGAVYPLIRDPDAAYVHMNRAPGQALDYYIDKLDGEQFLKLACALLEEVPQQLKTIISTGKHSGKTIVHCDLKFSNIMAAYQDGNWVITVIDMGMAKAMQDGQHKSTTPRGNILAFDGNMLLAKSHRKPIIYSAQTDLYALYTLILALAGAKHRQSLTYEYQLNIEIQAPDFTGLFEKMDIDLGTQTSLHQLLIKALLVDSEKRPPHDEILSAFRAALAKHTPKVVAQSSEPQPQTSSLVTATDLKKCVETDLHKKKDEYRAHKFSSKLAVLDWIGKYRNLCAQVSEAEMASFKVMLATPDAIKITNHYIFDIIRWNLLEEYDDLACFRLITLHARLTSPIRNALRKYSDKLPEQWSSFFQRVRSELPLQLTTAQKESCTEIGELITSVATFLDWYQLENPTPEHQLIKVYLDSLLSINFEELLNILPEFASQFNVLIYCLKKIKDTVYRYERVLAKNPAFEDKLDEWTYDLPGKLLKSHSPAEMDAYFSVRNTFANQIMKMYESPASVKKLYKQFPAMTRSASYNEDNLFKEINTISLSDTDAISKLSQKIDAVLMLAHLNTIFNNVKHPLRKHPLLMKPYFSRFDNLIFNSLENDSLLDKATDLFNNILAVERIVQSITEMNKYNSCQFIKKALFHLMADYTHTIALLNHLTPIKHSLYMDKLDIGLKNHFNHPSSQGLSQRLFKEIEIYSKDPAGYRPYKATIAASSTSFGLYPQPASQPMKDCQASSSTVPYEFR